MYDDLTAQGSQGCGIEVEVTVDECMGGELRLNPGSALEVESEICLWDQ